MSSKRPAEDNIDGYDFLDMSQAMRYSHRYTEDNFKKDFPELVVYDGGGCFLFDKSQLKSLMKKKIIRERLCVK